MGVFYLMDPVDGDIIVAGVSHWAFENTGLVNGSKLTGLLGYEVDGLGGDTPHGLRFLAASPAKSLLDPTSYCHGEHDGLCRSLGRQSLCDWAVYSGLGDWMISMRRTFARRG